MYDSIAKEKVGKKMSGNYVFKGGGVVRCQTKTVSSSAQLNFSRKNVSFLCVFAHLKI